MVIGVVIYEWLSFCAQLPAYFIPDTMYSIYIYITKLDSFGTV
jgi:hypothetical protein